MTYKELDMLAKRQIGFTSKMLFITRVGLCAAVIFFIFTLFESIFPIICVIVFFLLLPVYKHQQEQLNFYRSIRREIRK